mmetsp:Transcript_16457/g.23064  ORF Transcript_16457/g.23064 Transcript_16457/m.23064 type:complete len:586 (-) Transcript_16457:881-2638(-)
MCPTTCDLYVCNNPKAVNPATGDIVFLARENSSGKLVWMRAEEGMAPPPDQIISRAPSDGGIPQELITKLQKVGGDSAPVLLLHGSESVNLSSLPQVGGRGEGVTSGTQITTTSSSAVASFTGVKRRSSFDGSDLDTDTDDKSSSNKRSPTVEEEETDQRLSEKDALFLPPLARSPSSSLTGISSSSSLPISKVTRTSKRRKIDINHRKLKKPKHPKTGYNFFQMSIRDKLVDKIPMDDRVLHNETVARIIGKKWKALSKQERKVFQTLAEQDKTRYENELKDYLQKMYELGADTRSVVAREQKKKAHSRRCFSYDGAISSRLVSGKKKRERITKTAITTTQSGSVSSIKDATASEKKELGDLKNKRRKKSKREECRRRKDYYYGAVECDGSVQSSKRLLGAKEKSTKQINKHPKEETINGNNYLESKLKLGQQITNALGMPAFNDVDKMASSATTATSNTTSFLSEQWLNDAFSIPWGKDYSSNPGATASTRIRSSLSCENLPLSSHHFDPAGFFDKPPTFSDRKLGGGGGANPFGHPADDLYLSNFRDSTFMDSSGSAGSPMMIMKSPPVCPSLPNIDTYFKV